MASPGSVSLDPEAVEGDDRLAAPEYGPPGSPSGVIADDDGGECVLVQGRPHCLFGNRVQSGWSVTWTPTL